MSSHRAQPQQLYTAALPTPLQQQSTRPAKAKSAPATTLLKTLTSLSSDSVLPRGHQPSVICPATSQISSLTSHLLTHCFSPKSAFLLFVKYPRPIFTSGSLLTVCLLKLQRFVSNIQVTGSLISLKCLAKCPFYSDIHPDYSVQMCNPYLYPSLPNPLYPGLFFSLALLTI